MHLCINLLLTIPYQLHKLLSIDEYYMWGWGGVPRSSLLYSGSGSSCEPCTFCKQRHLYLLYTETCYLVQPNCYLVQPVSCILFYNDFFLKRPLRRPRRRCENNIKVNLKEVGCGGLEWIDLTQDRYRWRALVNAVMKLRVPYYAENFLTSWELVSFSRRTLTVNSPLTL
jgi:hypothetical protein